MSPTTFDVGVTLTISPNSSFTSRVRARDFVPAIREPEAARLLAQVGVLAARHAVYVNLGRTGANIAFERRITIAHWFEVARDHADVLRVEAGRARIVAQRLDDRARGSAAT